MDDVSRTSNALVLRNSTDLQLPKLVGENDRSVKCGSIGTIIQDVGNGDKQLSGDTVEIRGANEAEMNSIAANIKDATHKHNVINAIIKYTQHHGSYKTMQKLISNDRLASILEVLPNAVKTVGIKFTLNFGQNERSDHVQPDVIAQLFKHCIISKEGSMTFEKYQVPGYVREALKATWKSVDDLCKYRLQVDLERYNISDTLYNKVATLASSDVEKKLLVGALRWYYGIELRTNAPEQLFFQAAFYPDSVTIEGLNVYTSSHIDKRFGSENWNRTMVPWLNKILVDTYLITAKYILATAETANSKTKMLGGLLWLYNSIVQHGIAETTEAETYFATFYQKHRENPQNKALVLEFSEVKELDSVVLGACCSHCSIIEVHRVPGEIVHTYNAILEDFILDGVSKRVQYNKIRWGYRRAIKAREPLVVICGPLLYVASNIDGNSYTIEAIPQTAAVGITYGTGLQIDIKDKRQEPNSNLVKSLVDAMFERQNDDPKRAKYDLATLVGIALEMHADSELGVTMKMPADDKVQYVIQEGKNTAIWHAKIAKHCKFYLTNSEDLTGILTRSCQALEMEIINGKWVIGKKKCTNNVCNMVKGALKKLQNLGVQVSGSGATITLKDPRATFTATGYGTRLGSNIGIFENSTIGLGKFSECEKLTAYEVRRQLGELLLASQVHLVDLLASKLEKNLFENNLLDISETSSHNCWKWLYTRYELYGPNPVKSTPGIKNHTEVHHTTEGIVYYPRDQRESRCILYEANHPHTLRSMELSKITNCHQYVGDEVALIRHCNGGNIVCELQLNQKSSSPLTGDAEDALSQDLWHVTPALRTCGTSCRRASEFERGDATIEIGTVLTSST